ncbi:MAG: hypothetical protein EOP05_03690 [Proteobacteria bacterium]|nr:MAG: hypothetical protein EOP05_03690 [Pseudomonadota bacterium]
MKTALALLALAPMMVAQNAFARTDAEEYADLLAKAKITLAQAADTAAARVSGTVVKIELDSNRGQVVFEADVLAGNRLYDVNINAEDGTVLDVHEDLD